MANPENLIPNEQRTPKQRRENARKAGIESGKARREAKRRGEMWKELVNTEVTNEKMLENLRALGFTEEHPTYEMYIKAMAMKDLLKNAKMRDVALMDDELYGLLDRKQQLEVSGEATGITVNIKRCDKEEHEQNNI